MINKIFPIIQLCDSNFPSGAFSHSFGLETFIQQDLVKNRETFEAFLKEYLFQNLVYNDGLATRIAYEFVENGDEKALWTLDEMLYISCTAAESREASRRIGQQMIRICKELYPSADRPRNPRHPRNPQCRPEPSGRTFGLHVLHRKVEVRLPGVRARPDPDRGRGGRCRWTMDCEIFSDPRHELDDVTGAEKQREIARLHRIARVLPRLIAASREENSTPLIPDP